MLKKLYLTLLSFLVMGAFIAYAEPASKPLPKEFPKNSASQAKLAQKIAQSMDNKRSYPSAKLIGEMIIKDPHLTKTQNMVLYSRGDIDSLIQFTSGESKNQKVLRTEDEIYIYYPDLAQQIRLSGASLRQSLAGSDVSYEDLTSIKKTLASFKVAYLGSEKVNGYDSWIIYLEQKKGLKDNKGKKKSEAYPIQRLWVDKKSYLPIRGEYYSPSKKLLKVINILSYKKDGSYSIPTKMVLEDKLKKGTATTINFTNVDIHAKITDRTFSLENLTF